MNDSRFDKDRPTDGFEEKIVQVNRVSKKTKGGNKIGFSVLTVVGNKKGKVGVGLGKGPEIASAIKKGVLLGKKHVIDVPIIHGTHRLPSLKAFRESIAPSGTPSAEILRKEREAK